MATFNGNLMEKIRNLSNIPESEYPFITLYMDVNSQQFFDQNRKNKIFLRNSISNAESNLKKEHNKHKIECFRNDVKKIEYFIDNELNTRTHGLAIFACDRLGVFETFQTIMPFDNEFIVNSIPHLKQLAYQADECENALVIMSDSKYAKIFIVKLGGYIIEQKDIENEVHRFHKQGGWAQMRYQRHIENQEMKHYKDVANTAIHLVNENNIDNIILIGQHNEMMRFEQFLPKRIKSKIINTNSLYMRENINVILESIIDDLKNNEDKKEENYVEDIIEKAPRSSVTGMQDTIKLVQEGRSEILVIPNYKKYQGWKCDGCLYVAKDQHQPGCAQCNGKTKETDLIEELIRLNFRNSGKIEIVKNHAAQELEKYEGIGAIIRY